jgi:dienelactone hydrolase
MMKRWAGAMVAMAAMATFQAAHADARFDVQPVAAIGTGGANAIVLEGLQPNTELVLRAERVVHSEFLGGQRKRFRSEAVFVADAQGKVDLSRLAPRRGSYAGADLHGLFWSMRPTDDALQAQDKTGVVRLQALQGEQVVAEVQLPVRGPGDSVQLEKLADFPGAVLAKPKGATGKLPVIVVLGGAEGGSGAAQHAPRLAALGFAVLGLPYYSPAMMPGGRRELPGLPADFANIELRQLDAVRAWLRKRDDVDAARIGLFGASKGAEFALLAASHLDWVKAVVAVAPTDVVWEGFGWNTEPGSAGSFALDGKGLAFVPYKGFIEEMMHFESNQPVKLRRAHDQGRAAHPAKVASARIPVERFRGALLLLAGEDDQLWNAAAMAHNIAERRADAGRSTEVHIYNEAGHYLIGDGWGPTTHYNAGLKQSGGTPSGTARAQVDATARISAFLRRAL